MQSAIRLCNRSILMPSTFLSAAVIILRSIGLQNLLHLRRELRLNLYSALMTLETSTLIYLMALIRLI